jgi:antitoxin component YwqK of YwqJK toxin-antitoxin module
MKKNGMLLINILLMCIYCMAQDVDSSYILFKKDSSYSMFKKNLDSTYLIYQVYSNNGEILEVSSYKHLDSDSYMNGLYRLYKDGVISEERYYIMDTIAGCAIYYYANGNTERIDHYTKDSLMTEITFYDNGVIKRIGSYVFANKYGDWLYYYENGMLCKFENYSLIEVTKDNIFDLVKKYNLGIIVGDHICIKSGRWRYYGETGNISKEEVYKNNILIETIEY